jgi:hypothetical protein
MSELKDIESRCTMWEQQVFTQMETVGFLLDRFAFDLLDRPDATTRIVEALNSVPAPLLAGMIERLTTRCQRYLRIIGPCSSSTMRSASGAMPSRFRSAWMADWTRSRIYGDNKVGSKKGRKML